jgi:RimJ/RimL family protein N-acetyltransferase
MIDRMGQPTLHTERLRLQPLADEHLELEVELDSDPEVLRYLDRRVPSRAEIEQAHRRRLARGAEVPGLGIWMGFAGDGFVGLWMLQPPHGPDQPKVAGEADLGYRLLRSRWRQGFATEGNRELIRYGFQVVGLNRIFAQTLAVNTPSRASMSKAGLTFVRAFPCSDTQDAPEGAEHGEVEYEITRATWDQGRASRAIV